MTSALAESVEENIQDEMKNSDYISIICDESCDIANFKQLIIYFMFMSKDGDSRTVLADICNIDDRKADTIVDAIMALVNKRGININNIVGIGTDGAAVMTGCKNGVAVKLKNSGALYLMQIHCAAHSFTSSITSCKKRSFN